MSIEERGLARDGWLKLRICTTSFSPVVTNADANLNGRDRFRSKMWKESLARKVRENDAQFGDKQT